MGYVLKAVLSSAQHPEYGQITVPFPIPDEKYDRMIELLEPLEIGDALRQDCRVDELDSFYTVLNRLVGSLVNFDELDYLAKRLDSFDDGEAAQFQGMACKLGVSNIKDFINLTFCCQQATVITDFSDLDAIGRQHYMTMQGGGCRIEELERLDGRKFALDLILNHLEGRITPYGVVYDNGMKLEQLYDGRHFPCYHYQPNLLAVGLSSRQEPENTDQITWLLLPCSEQQLQRGIARSGVNIHDARIWYEDSLLPSEVEEVLEGQREDLFALNDMATAIAALSDLEQKKLTAVMEMAKPECAGEIRELAKNLELFEFAPKVRTPAEYGRYMIQDSGHYEYDPNLEEFYDYERYGKLRMEKETGAFTEKGYVAYAEQGKFDILLVFMFDRLGRKSDETPFVVEWFTKKGVRVWSVQEGEQRFESHTDRLTNYIRFWQADGESQKTSMRTKTALGQMVEEGRFRGGNAPYGYRLEKSGILNKRKHEVYMLVIDEDEARVVRMMFDLCISSGYGRWRLANFLNDHGIKNRKGQNWHDASVGGILHNPLYKGILRSGETYAGPFEALQIIAPDQFDLAQKLMLERTNERKERRTVPLNTAGQSLLSGNIFCGHCGGRLVLTTNGTTTRLADGTPVHKKRIRYVCYNKTRRRQECTGQTGYTMHILDGIVTEVLHQVFDKMQGASNDMIVGSAVQKQMAMIRSELQRARAENTKANKEYESLKSEVLKAIQGKSALPQDVLTEMLEDTRQKVLSTSERITTLTAELNDGNSKIEEMKAEFNRIVSWSKIFDESPMEVKKMICGYIIKKVSVFRDYRVKIEFNINVEQFLNGIDSIDECATYELPMAQ